MTREALQTTLLSKLTPGQSYTVERLVNQLLTLAPVDRDTAYFAVASMVYEGDFEYDDDRNVILQDTAYERHAGYDTQRSADTRAAS